MDSPFPDLTLISRGKVRDVYDLHVEGVLLFVASDRISAFDIEIPNKGKILTQLSEFWFNYLSDTIGNHFITSEIDMMPQIVHKYRAILEGRSMLVKKLDMLPVEAIVRGYLAGSGWKEYSKDGRVCEIALPKGLHECEKLASPLFTPSTKAAVGDHDENIHPEKLVEMIGKDRANEIASIAVELYKKASDYALEKGIIIADTKFEFGLDSAGTLVLADEVLTPDSSRFWPASEYRAGGSQESYDKQFVRDWLLANTELTGVKLPDSIVLETMKKYCQACEILTGRPANI